MKKETGHGWSGHYGITQAELEQKIKEHNEKLVDCPECNGKGTVQQENKCEHGETSAHTVMCKGPFEQDVLCDVCKGAKRKNCSDFGTITRYWYSSKDAGIYSSKIGTVYEGRLIMGESICTRCHSSNSTSYTVICAGCGVEIAGSFSCDNCHASGSSPGPHSSKLIDCPNCNGTGYTQVPITCRHGQASEHPCCEHDRMEPHND